jgi:hypothetical protein
MNAARRTAQRRDVALRGGYDSWHDEQEKLRDRARVRRLMRRWGVLRELLPRRRSKA